MATQNPIEQEGTYPLPEAQVDRFMLKVIIDYPKLEEEKKIIRQNINGERTEVRPILKAEDIIAAREVVRQVYLDEKIEQYIADIVFATRYPEKYDLKELKGLDWLWRFSSCFYQPGTGCTQLRFHQTSWIRDSGRRESRSS